MNTNKDNQVVEDVLSSQKSRRKFLRRAGTGALIASIPAKSVWATGLAGSITASGHGSDYAGGETLALLSPGYWKNHKDDWYYYTPSDQFSAVFGGQPFYKAKKGGLFDKKGNQFDLNDVTLGQIIDNPGGNKAGGPGNVNVFLIQTLLCAAAHGQMLTGSSEIYFPVVKSRIDAVMGTQRGLFETLPDFATYLHSNASSAPRTYGRDLSAFLDANHA